MKTRKTPDSQTAITEEHEERAHMDEARREAVEVNNDLKASLACVHTRKCIAREFIRNMLFDSTSSRSGLVSAHAEGKRDAALEKLQEITHAAPRHAAECVLRACSLWNYEEVRNLFCSPGDTE